MEAISIKLAGKSSATFAREIVTRRSSMGWRITSKTVRLNSGNSSKNNTPLCDKDISPGCGTLPPPTNATSLIVWCGERNGRLLTNELPSGNLPATLCILVVSNASCKLKGGRIVGSRFASRVLQDPGGPRG